MKSYLRLHIAMEYGTIVADQMRGKLKGCKSEHLLRQD